MCGCLHARRQMASMIFVDAHITRKRPPPPTAVSEQARPRKARQWVWCSPYLVVRVCPWVCGSAFHHSACLPATFLGGLRLMSEA